MSFDNFTIHVSNHSKRYPVGRLLGLHTLSNAIVDSVKAPFNRASSMNSSRALKGCVIF